MTATAMGIANVIGVYHGHFGKEFASIGTDELTIFTKVNILHDSYSHMLTMFTDPFCDAVLPSLQHGLCQVFPPCVL